MPIRFPVSYNATGIDNYFADRVVWFGGIGTGKTQSVIEFGYGEQGVRRF